MKKFLAFVILILIVLGVFYFSNKKQAIAPVVSAPVVKNTKLTSKIDIKQGEICFAKFSAPDANGLSDKYTLRLVLNGDKATGELNFLPAEKDRKTGEVAGTVSALDKATGDRTAELEWFNFAEGGNGQEEEKIIFSEKTAKVGLGEMVLGAGGGYVYKDPKNISYALSLPYMSCADLAKRANVENL